MKLVRNVCSLRAKNVCSFLAQNVCSGQEFLLSSSQECPFIPGQEYLVWTGMPGSEQDFFLLMISFTVAERVFSFLSVMALQLRARNIHSLLVETVCSVGNLFSFSSQEYRLSSKLECSFFSSPVIKNMENIELKKKT